MGELARRPAVTGDPYRGKRALDVLLLILSSPVWVLAGAVCAVAVRVDSRGPALFRQRRVGLAGRPFIMLKFRSMVAADDNPLFPDPTRITRVGHLLRRVSLDELPQVLNVLRGDMSLVGPRPTLAYQVRRYGARERRRLDVRPGITGLAQVRGRNAITWRERIRHDLEYVETASLGLDLRILARTAGAVLRGRGVSGHPVDDELARVPDIAGGEGSR